ncbi:MAG: SAM-dependent DNA methyltransferase [Chloroflexota bacterium]|jgi:type I restriction-modification system DNA methylase subunit
MEVDLKRLAKWRTVEDVARAFAGWYNINDVRRFITYLADQYRQGDVLEWSERPRDPQEIELYFHVMTWLNLRILRGQYDDVLGELYMAVGYPNRDGGQFFTPYHLARLMAEMQLPEDRAAALEIACRREDGKISIFDPACGSGVMLCAAWEVAQERGYGDLVEFYGQDIDPYCVVMARVNLIMRREIPALQEAVREQEMAELFVQETPVRVAEEALA